MYEADLDFDADGHLPAHRVAGALFVVAAIACESLAIAYAPNLASLAALSFCSALTFTAMVNWSRPTARRMVAATVVVTLLASIAGELVEGHFGTISGSSVRRLPETNLDGLFALALQGVLLGFLRSLLTIPVALVLYRSFASARGPRSASILDQVERRAIFTTAALLSVAIIGLCHPVLYLNRCDRYTYSCRDSVHPGLLEQEASSGMLFVAIAAIVFGLYAASRDWSAMRRIRRACAAATLEATAKPAGLVEIRTRNCVDAGIGYERFLAKEEGSAPYRSEPRAQVLLIGDPAVAIERIKVAIARDLLVVCVALAAEIVPFYDVFLD